jgi:hypothetical protein
MVDLAQIRKDAKANKDIAKQKIEASKREAVNRKLLKSNPVPQYVKPAKQVGVAEIDSAADLDAVSAGFRKRAMDEGKRFAMATDAEYWTCICFQSREQKEAFLAALDLLKFGDRYLDGQEVAQQLGIELPKADIPYKTSSKVDPTWASFVK